MNKLAWLAVLPVAATGVFLMTRKTEKAAQTSGSEATKEQQTASAEAAKLPRGIRNNNPGNIKFNLLNKWVGQTGHDGTFVIFDNAENGIRAMARLMKTYRDKYGLETIAGIINRWAPASENNTEAYIRSVEQRTGIFRGLFLQAGDYPAIVAAMIHHENGQQPYSTAMISKAVADGLK